MEERVKKLKAEMVLEYIVDLKIQQLLGYKLLSCIGTDYRHCYFFGYEPYNIHLK
jgi:hypothetical protein